jgi:hypothetical protein
MLLFLLALGAFRPTLQAQAKLPASEPPARAVAHHVPVRDVVRMALRAARTLSPSRAQELSRRARWAGLVPQLRLAARRGVQQDLSATSTLADDRNSTSSGDDLTLEASLTFQLDRLVFAPEQVRLLAVERALVSDRRRLIEDVVKLYFRRVRILSELALSPGEPELDAALGEVEALLDAFTDGAFGLALRGAG